MSTNELITVNVRTADHAEFVESFRNAVLELITLLCERRELDLCEQQVYAIGLLAHTAKQMEVIRFPPVRDPAADGRRTP